MKLSQSADVTVLVLGENEQLSREAWADNHRGDRMTLDLVGRQMDLARAVLAGHRPTVVLLIHTVVHLAVGELAARAPALLDGFYLGEETGTAVAEVLFGDVSPAGRLPVTVPRSVGTLPAYYDYKPSARRPYLFEDPGPLWLFGFGLTYAAFRYEGLSVSPSRIAPGGQVAVAVTVTNTSARASDEVVQLYVHDMVSSVTRPVEELRGVSGAFGLGPGESRRVTMNLGTAGSCPSTTRRCTRSSNPARSKSWSAAAPRTGSARRSKSPRPSHQPESRSASRLRARAGTGTRSSSGTALQRAA